MSLALVPPSHPTLWRVADPIVDYAPIPALAAQMINLMIKSGGVGLAAPQVGLSLSLCVLNVSIGLMVLVNPHIMTHGRDIEVEIEGCLSFPGRSREVKRWRVVTVIYDDALGMPCTTVFKGYDARIAQHEIAHLSGECLWSRPLEINS